VSAVAEIPTPPRENRVGRVTFPRVVHSEWTKLRSVRSTRWSFLLAIVFTIGLAALTSAVVEAHWSSMSPQDRADFKPLDVSFIGVFLAQLPIAVLGVLVITGEYSTGMIRASLTAVPKRLPMLWAKAAVFSAVTFLLMLPATLIAFFVAQAILSGQSIDIGLSHSGVLRAIVGAALFSTVNGLLALGIGASIRNTAGGIAAFAGLLFVIPPLLNVLPSSWNNAISPYLPGDAGSQIMSISHSGGHSLSPWAGFAVLCGWAAAALALAALLLVRRDT
jgi:ABC-2 type transport system permease protein